MSSTRVGSMVALLAGVALCVLAVAGCGGGGDEAAAGSGDPATDKLAQVLARGTLVVSTDPAYPPQSFAVKGATRRVDTKCATNQLTAREVSGFDVDTAVKVAAALGVEPCFVTPSWTEVTSGNWGDRWDLSIGSMGITRERMGLLWFVQPYYASGANFWVRKDSPVKAVKQLDGKRIGACVGCIHEAYLQKNLDIPGAEVTYALDNPEIVGFDVEPPGFKALAAGKVDAFLADGQVGEAAIDGGLPLRAVGKPVFYSYLAPAVDQASGKSQTAFVDRLNEVIASLHADGSLGDLSRRWFGGDLTAEAGTFDWSGLEQQVT